MEYKPIRFEQINPISVGRILELLRVKRVLIIRPKLPNDNATILGSYVWAGKVLQYAIDHGWEVRDLAINDANRQNVEDTINDFKPTLVLHYDHGSESTQWGQNADVKEPAIDLNNIDLLSNRVASAVSCLTARMLGPLSITNGCKAYLGYDESLTFTISRADQFGDAANAANKALLECKSIEDAHQACIDAYNELIDDLFAEGDWFAAGLAIFDRDSFLLLGNGDTTACPARIVCHKALPFAVHCTKGNPDWSVIVPRCKLGQFDTGLCKKGLPDSHCDIGLPDIPEDILCKGGLQDSGFPGCNGLPMDCHAGPYYGNQCNAGPIVEIDFRKIPKDLQKSLRTLLKKINAENGQNC